MSEDQPGRDQSTDWHPPKPDEVICELVGVREHAEGMPVELVRSVESGGRLCLKALNEAGFNCTLIDLADLRAWLASEGQNFMSDKTTDWRSAYKQMEQAYMVLADRYAEVARALGSPELGMWGDPTLDHDQIVALARNLQMPMTPEEVLELFGAPCGLMPPVDLAELELYLRYASEITDGKQSYP